MANFQTGPVDVSDAVREAYAGPVVSHRASEFAEVAGVVVTSLRTLTKSHSVTLRPGGGTLANDMIAAQLSGKGLIVSRGEFGRRLAQHARGAGLTIAVLDRVPEDVEADWIWAVHCETSTGEMADLPALGKLAAKIGARLCLDCVSSIGAVEIDLSDVYLASFASGKALASVAGVCGVFAGRDFVPKAAPMPRCLAMETSVPSTFPSGPLFALQAALGSMSSDRYREVRMAGREVRVILDSLGIGYLMHVHQAPHVVTVPVNKAKAVDVASRLAARGVIVSAGSEYLVGNNWLQIAVMGHQPLRHLGTLYDALAAVWPC